MNLFKKLPLIDYAFEQGDYFYLKNIFIKLRVIDSLKNDPSFLTTYSLNSYERADVIAHKLYGRSDLFWTLYLVNDVVDPNEWLMNQYNLDKFVKEKYVNTEAVHHYERKGAQADLRANQILTVTKPFGTTDSSPEFDLTDPSTYEAVTNYSYEDTVNDSKRIIRAIRKEYMPSFLIDVEKKLRNINNV